MVQPLSDVNAGWIKLYRQLLDKPIWSCSTIEQRVILITILLLANHADKQWEWKGKKFVCKAGQLVTSLPSLAEKSGCSIQNVRTTLKRFQEYGFLTDESTKTGRLITVVNWEKYQAKEYFLTDKPTDNQQRANRQLTANNNDKDNKNDKKIYSPDSQEYILSRYLLEKILSNNPGFKTPNINIWAKSMDLMLRIDHRLPDEVKEVIDFCQADAFWKTNILSIDKLRRQYDQLNTKRLSQKKVVNINESSSSHRPYRG